MKPSRLVSPEPLSNAKSEFLFNHAIQTLKLNISPVKFFHYPLNKNFISSENPKYISRKLSICQENVLWTCGERMCCCNLLFNLGPKLF